MSFTHGESSGIIPSLKNSLQPAAGVREGPECTVAQRGRGDTSFLLFLHRTQKEKSEESLSFFFPLHEAPPSVFLQALRKDSPPKAVFGLSA